MLRALGVGLLATLAAAVFALAMIVAIAAAQHFGGMLGVLGLCAVLVWAFTSFTYYMDSR